jgi:hypothetical protein
VILPLVEESLFSDVLYDPPPGRHAGSVGIPNPAGYFRPRPYLRRLVSYLRRALEALGIAERSKIGG